MLTRNCSTVHTRVVVSSEIAHSKDCHIMYSQQRERWQNIYCQVVVVQAWYNNMSWWNNWFGRSCTDNTLTGMSVSCVFFVFRRSPAAQLLVAPQTSSCCSQLLLWSSGSVLLVDSRITDNVVNTTYVETSNSQVHTFCTRPPVLLPCKIYHCLFGVH